MIIGRLYKVTSANEMGKTGHKPKAWGECVWVHPERRFCVLQFSDGSRECFTPLELGVA
jgi:hypothetical protein